VAFTFTNTAACNATVQTFPVVDPLTAVEVRTELDTNSTKLANLDAAVSTRSTYAGGAVASVTAGVTVTTNNDKSNYTLAAGHGLAVDSTVAKETTLGVVAGYLDTEISAIKLKTDNLPAQPAAVGSNMGSVASVTAGVIVADKTGFSLATAPPTAAETATAVWANATRSLTTFGSLVADIATAVWGAATRTLSAFGFTVPATVADKTGYSLATAPPTVLQIRTEMDTNSTKLTNLDATISSRSTLAAGAAMTLTGAYDAAKTSATQASVDAIPTTPLLAANYIAPDNTSTAAIKLKTDQLVFVGGKVEANATATVDTTAVATGVLDALLADHTVEGSLAVKISDLTAGVDPMATVVAGSDPPVTRGDMIDSFYIPDYIGPVVTIPAPTNPDNQRLYGSIKELGAVWAEGDTLTLTPTGTQTANGSILSNQSVVCSVATTGSIIDPADGLAGTLVDKGAMITIECKRGTNPVVTYFSKTITITADDTKDVSTY